MSDRARSCRPVVPALLLLAFPFAAPAFGRGSWFNRAFRSAAERNDAALGGV